MKIYIGSVRRMCEECDEGYTFVQWATHCKDLCDPMRKVAVKFAEKMRVCPDCGTYLKTEAEVTEKEDDESVFLGFGQIWVSWDEVKE